MHRFGKRPFLTVIAFGFGLLFYSCMPKYYRTLVSDIPSQPIKPTEKFPYKVAFVVDGKFLNTIREVNYVNMFIVYSALGRSLCIPYKELLDRHFEDVVMVWGDDDEMIKTCDLKAKITIDDYHAEIPMMFTPFVDGPFYMSVTYLIEVVDGPVIIKRKMTDIEMGKYCPFSRDHRVIADHFQNTIDRFTSDAVHSMFSKFSLELEASPRLHLLDFKDFEGFLGQLEASGTPLSKFLFSKLSPLVQEELCEFADDSEKDSSSKTAEKTADSSKPKSIPRILKIDFIDQMNTILEKELLPDNALNTDAAGAAINQYTSGRGNMGINRKLLEQAYLQYLKAFDVSVYEKLKSLPPRGQQKSL